MDEAGDGEEGLYFGQEFSPDVAIIDLGLPGLPGMDLIRRLRADGAAFPILILTARGRWEEKVDGLGAGADDIRLPDMGSIAKGPLSVKRS